MKKRLSCPENFKELIAYVNPRIFNTLCCEPGRNEIKDAKIRKNFPEITDFDLEIDFKQRVLEYGKGQRIEIFDWGDDLMQIVQNLGGHVRSCERCLLEYKNFLDCQTNDYLGHALLKTLELRDLNKSQLVGRFLDFRREIDKKHLNLYCLTNLK